MIMKVKKIKGGRRKRRRTADITQIFKKGDINMPGIYRPINLISVVGKI